MKRIIILLLPIVLAVFLVLCGCARSVSISGEVMDSATWKGIPANITVTVYAADKTYTYSEDTDSNGAYSVRVRLYGDIEGIKVAAGAAGYDVSSLKLVGEFVPDNIIIKFLLVRL